MGSCNQDRGKVCTKKGKDVSVVKGRERRSVQVYPRTAEEGYIRSSKLPQIAFVSFVGKKDSKKYMIQDYRYLNEWTIKNNYPLPLILDIVENIGTKKVFTKLNLQ